MRELIRPSHALIRTCLLGFGPTAAAERCVRSVMGGRQVGGPVRLLRLSSAAKRTRLALFRHVYAAHQRPHGREAELRAPPCDVGCPTMDDWFYQNYLDQVRAPYRWGPGPIPEPPAERQLRQIA